MSSKAGAKGAGRTQVTPENVDTIGPGETVDPGRGSDQDPDLAAAPKQGRNHVAAEKSSRSRDQYFQNRNSSAVKAATRSLTSTICRAETGGSVPERSAS